MRRKKDFTKYIHSVRFGFENCESLEIPGKYFFNLLINDISRMISDANGSMMTPWMLDFLCAKQVRIGIIREGDDKYVPFGVKQDTTTKFKRLSESRDICWIDIRTWDGKHKRTLEEQSFGVKWNEDDEYNNKYQSNTQNSRGDLFIEICEDVGKKNFKPNIDTWFFDEEEANKQFSSKLQLSKLGI